MGQYSNYKLQITNYRRGQVMLFTVLIVSAVFLTVTAIAGVIMGYQLRQVTNIVESAQAIFAADAAIQRGVFVVKRCNGNAPLIPVSWSAPQPPYNWTGNVSDMNEFCDLLALQNVEDPMPPGVSVPLPAFLNGARYRLVIPSTAVPPGTHDPDATVSTIISPLTGSGFKGKAARIFGYFFSS